MRPPPPIVRVNADQLLLEEGPISVCTRRTNKGGQDRFRSDDY